MKQPLTNRIIIAAIALLAGLLIVFYSETRSGNVSDSGSLTDIKNIDTLRIQFNLDAGKTRLVILVSPT
jgi:hypothetical protein